MGLLYPITENQIKTSKNELIS